VAQLAVPRSSGRPLKSSAANWPPCRLPHFIAEAWSPTGTPSPLSFKGVLLEGLEVAFIALTFGANQRNVPLAAFAALSAVLVVAVAGITLRAPLTRVPENAMKFIVGVMLTSFGIFWGAEGAGARWPAGDAALLVLVPAVALFAITLVAALRRAGSRAVSSKVADESPS
jgi:hypothetical protein